MTYENSYGLGYERATEPGPDVEIYGVDKWCKKLPVRLHEKLDPQLIYRRPIKLQVGHRYVRRDGVVVRVQNIDKRRSEYCRCYGDDGLNRYENGRRKKHKETVDDLVTHIEEPETKEEQMKDTVTVNNVAMTYAQIEAAHAEMMRQKAENEIKVEDIVKVKGNKIMFLVTQVHLETGKVSTETIEWKQRDNLEKVTGTPEFMAQLRAVLEGK